MSEHNITFRKMPRDWNLLPETVQDEIRAINPDYEKQWLESTEFDRDFEAWQSAQQEPIPIVPRYTVQKTAFVQVIQSDLAFVGLDKPADFKDYLIRDTETGGFVKDANGSNLGFQTEAQAQSYCDKLNGGKIRLPKMLAQNYRITDDRLGKVGAKTKFRNNISALQTLKTFERENRAATPEEQEVLLRYVG
jgi:hypothetical protein